MFLILYHEVVFYRWKEINNIIYCIFFMKDKTIFSILLIVTLAVLVAPISHIAFAQNTTNEIMEKNLGIKNEAESLVENATSSAQQVESIITKGAQSAATGAAQQVESIINEGAENVTEGAEQAGQVITEGAENVTEGAEQAGQVITEGAENVTEGAQEKGKNILDQIFGGIGGLFK